MSIFNDNWEMLLREFEADGVVEDSDDDSTYSMDDDTETNDQADDTPEDQENVEDNQEETEDNEDEEYSMDETEDDNQPEETEGEEEQPEEIEEEQDDEDYESPLDILFKRLERRSPDHIAVKYYKDYHSGAGRTLKSIQVTLTSKLEKFNLKSVIITV